MIRQFQHFINGHSTPPNSGEWIDSINPATGAVWAQIARGNKADVDLAVETALTASQQPIGETVLPTGPKFCMALLTGWTAIISSSSKLKSMTMENAFVRSQPKWPGLADGIVILLSLLRKWKLRN